jgi:DNA-binding NarL/FixJ family response regulator
MSGRLLIVDDDAGLLRALEMMLRADGYDVRTARGGADALVRLTHFQPDLIISDIRMPGMDGHAFVRTLRDAPRTKLIPIIFLSAKDSKDDRVAGFRSGVDVYLTKPFEPDELCAVIASILARVERTHTEIARMVGGDKNNAGFFLDEDLTESENRIAAAVARGLTNKEIADEFNISSRTVETHVRRILAKKRFSNRVEIARLVMERGGSSA